MGIGAGSHAAVEDEIVAGHERGFGGAEPEDGFGDFGRFTEPAQGMQGEHAFVIAKAPASEWPPGRIANDACATEC